MNDYLLVLALIVLITLSAFFSGVETAIVSISRLNAKVLARQKKAGSESLLRVKMKQRKILIALLVGNNIVNIVAASIATAVSINLFGSAGVGIAVGVTTFFILVFGEVLPKSFASTNAERVALMFSPLLEVLVTIFSPIVSLFELITNFVHGSVSKNAPSITEKKLMQMLDVGVEEKVIEKQEKEFIENLLQFNDTIVKKVMVPKERMVTMPANTTVSAALDIITKYGYSRYPLISKKGEVVGTLHVKDILKATSMDKMRRTVRKLATLPFFVSKNHITDDVFKEMQAHDFHMACIQDDENNVIGLVTLEDLLEELVGEIRDEQERKKLLGKK